MSDDSVMKFTAETAAADRAIVATLIVTLVKNGLVDGARFIADLRKIALPLAAGQDREPVESRVAEQADLLAKLLDLEAQSGRTPGS